MSLRNINSLLLTQMDTGDSDEDVACDWLLSNPDTWAPWLPERGKCYLQFGMYSVPWCCILQSDFAAIWCHIVPLKVVRLTPPKNKNDLLEERNY